MSTKNSNTKQLCTIDSVSCSFEDELNRLKEFWERRYINENDIKILENEVKSLSEKYGKNLSFSHNYGKNKDNRIYVSINSNQRFRLNGRFNAV
jgi:hypothetical protein